MVHFGVGLIWYCSESLRLLFATGVLLLWLSPTWWGYYLSALDVRIWPPWKCIGLVVILMESLLVIRLLAEQEMLIVGKHHTTRRVSSWKRSILIYVDRLAVAVGNRQHVNSVAGDVPWAGN